MRRIIHHIRKQPEEVRRHILHVATIVCGIILLVLWLYSLGANFSNSDSQAKMDNDMEPLSALKDNLVGGYQSISDSELRAQTDSL